MAKTQVNKEEKLKQDIKELVMARIKVSSRNLRISVGSEQYNHEDILKSIEEGGELGEKVIDAQMRFLRDMAEGKLYADE